MKHQNQNNDPKQEWPETSVSLTPAESTEPENKIQDTTKIPLPKVQVIAQSLYLREGPSTTAPHKAFLSKGTVLEVTNNENPDWLLVLTADHGVGYVMAVFTAPIE